MKKEKILIDINKYPGEIEGFLKDADIYDSSCSDAAKVIFIDKEDGYYLKTAPKGFLKKEAELAEYFYKKGMGTEVIGYISTDKDYFLTQKADGEDGTYFKFIQEPKKLSETVGVILRKLHEEDFSDCPVSNRNESYFETVKQNYKAGIFENSLTEYTKGLNRESAYSIAREGKGLLKNEVLLHGDYCLPNIVLKDWKLSSFIDLGNGGLGDRHIDLFWGAWSLNYNLGEKKCAEMFFDAYGRDKVNFEILRIIAAMECFG